MTGRSVDFCDADTGLLEGTFTDVDGGTGPILQSLRVSQELDDNFLLLCLRPHPSDGGIKRCFRLTSV